MESSPEPIRKRAGGAGPGVDRGATTTAASISKVRLGWMVLALTLPARGEPSFFQARVAPILDRHCTVCHGEEKQKSGLRLDTFAFLQRGGESGTVVAPGDVKESELFRRITLPADDEDVMPSDGKPGLTAYEKKIIELWIAGGASESAPLSAFPDAPAPPAPRPPPVPLAPDWRPHAGEIAALESAAGVRLTPRSAVPTDGLVLRTVSAPGRCDDAALKRLAPVAELIVEAELARTKVTDAGLAAVATWANLRTLDLTRTAVTSDGVSALVPLRKLESINLTATPVDDRGVARLRTMPGLRRLWLFGTKTEAGAGQPEVAAK